MTSDKYDLMLKSAAEKRTVLFSDAKTDCFRLFNGEGDGLDGLTIDYYAGYLLLQYFNDNVYTDMNNIQNGAVSMAETLPGGVKAVLAKDRRAIADSTDKNEVWKSRIIEGDYRDDGIIVKQNGTLARIDLVNGQNTGIFLDMREIRQQLENFYPGSGIRSMINLFSYTALFSAHALMNGVAHAVNVDLSKGVLRRARENYELNGLAVDNRDFLYGDSLEWIKMLTKKKEFFNFAVFDPPTFARNRKRNFSVRKDYNESLCKLEKIIRGGYLLTSINSYSVSLEEYRSCHPDGWELLMFNNESSDFVNRGNPYLKVGLWKI